MTDDNALRVEVPPADEVSSAHARRWPNWGMKTAMAATGTTMSVILIATLIGIVATFASYATLRRSVEGQGDLGVVLGTPSPALIWTIGLITAVLAVTHVTMAVVLWRRSKSSRGARRALITGLHSWWTRSMPFTGAIVALGALAMLIWPPRVEVTVSLPDCVPGPDCYWMFDANVLSAMPGGLAYAIYLVTLLAAGLHVAHGLGTVTTIAAGTNAFAGRVRRWVVLVGGPLLALLVVAAAVIPPAFLRGWI